VTLQKYFSHPSLVIYFFPTTPMKLKLGLQIATHLNQSNLCSQSAADVRLCCAFYQRQQTLQKCWAKTILLSQTDMF
jgi:hypothetical protein